MANNQKISQRINLVSNISKITKAMELVATSKLRKLQNHLLNVKNYSDLVKETFYKTTSQIDERTLANLFPHHPQDAILYVVITSDLGLAGSYNSDSFKLINNTLRDQDKLLIFGNKGISHYAQKFDQILAAYREIPDQVDYQNLNEATNLIINNFFSGDFKEVRLIYTKFINILTNEKQVITLLPHTATNGTVVNDVEIEPDPETVFVSALPFYIGAVLYQAVAESKVCEFSARRVAMESSTKNAKELIKNLKIEFNRRRQAAITQEIAEIVAGSME